MDPLPHLPQTMEVVSWSAGHYNSELPLYTTDQRILLDGFLLSPLPPGVGHVCSIPGTSEQQFWRYAAYPPIGFQTSVPQPVLHQIQPIFPVMPTLTTQNVSAFHEELPPLAHAFVVHPGDNGQLNTLIPGYCNPGVPHSELLGGHWGNPVQQHFSIGQQQDHLGQLNYWQHQVPVSEEVDMLQAAAPFAIVAQPLEMESFGDNNALALPPAPHDMEPAGSFSEGMRWTADASRRQITTNCEQDSNTVAKDGESQQVNRADLNGSVEIGSAASPQDDTRKENQASGAAQRLTTPPNHERWIKSSQFCRLCKSNREPYDFYRSHSLMDENGIVTCPILRAHVCPICNATGDNAHTLRYCSQSREGNRRVVWRRNAAGSYFVSKY